MSASTTSFPTADLVRFLLARLDDEDEDVRRRARRLRDTSATETDEAAAVDRLRAESQARRQVVGSIQQLLVLRDLPNEKAVRDIAVQVLRSLATPYGEHISFREEWHSGTR